MQIITETEGDYLISTDKARVDLQAVHAFLTSDSYWAKNISLDKVRYAVEHSLNFGLFYIGSQIGYARVITDFANIAYLGDVFILEEHRGKKLSKWLLETVMAHPHLQGLRRWILLTADAHGLYRKYGWSSIAIPANWMEKHDTECYLSDPSG